MKKLIVMIAGILLLVCSAFGLYVEERDTGTKSTQNVVRVVADQVTTLNLIADMYFTLITNSDQPVIRLTTARNVSINVVGTPLYPSGNAHIKGNFENFASSKITTTVNVRHEFQ